MRRVISAGSRVAMRERAPSALTAREPLPPGALPERKPGAMAMNPSAAN
jgi:hypothetical protein